MISGQFHALAMFLAIISLRGLALTTALGLSECAELWVEGALRQDHWPAFQSQLWELFWQTFELTHSINLLFHLYLLMFSFWSPFWQKSTLELLEHFAAVLLQSWLIISGNKRNPQPPQSAVNLSGWCLWRGTEQCSDRLLTVHPPAPHMRQLNHTGPALILFGLVCWVGLAHLVGCSINLVLAARQSTDPVRRFINRALTCVTHTYSAII